MAHSDSVNLWVRQPNGDNVSDSAIQQLDEGSGWVLKHLGPGTTLERARKNLGWVKGRAETW